MIEAAKQNIELVSIVRSAGVELKRSGAKYVGLCPLHAEKTPSFFVFPDNRFKCFGCGEHGDCIHFIQKMYGLSFPDALKYLGIETGKTTPEIKRNIERRKRRAELVKKFWDWEQRYCSDISDLWHRTKRLMINGIPLEDLELYAPLFHILPIWEHHRDILINGSDREKYKLFRELRGPTWKKRILT